MHAFDPARVLNPGNLVGPGPAVRPAGLPADAVGGADVEIDAESLLAWVPGATPLAALEHRLAGRGLTLDAAPPADATLGTWLSAGAPGARDRWLDPTDQLLAGLDATLVDGGRLRIHPAPRRSVGPDLTALFIGAGGRFGRIDGAWMRVHRRDASRPAAAPFVCDRDPPLAEGERLLLDRIASSLGSHGEGTGKEGGREEGSGI
jgi:FAD/FMN-containing dehydrogenase